MKVKIFTKTGLTETYLSSNDGKLEFEKEIIDYPTQMDDIYVRINDWYKATVRNVGELVVILNDPKEVKKGVAIKSINTDNEKFIGYVKHVVDTYNAWQTGMTEQEVLAISNMSRFIGCIFEGVPPRRLKHLAVDYVLFDENNYNEVDGQELQNVLYDPLTIGTKPMTLYMNSDSEFFTSKRKGKKTNQFINTAIKMGEARLLLEEVLDILDGDSDEMLVDVDGDEYYMKDDRARNLYKYSDVKKIESKLYKSIETKENALYSMISSGEVYYHDLIEKAQKKLNFEYEMLVATVYPIADAINRAFDFEYEYEYV
tara:strand:+ start:176 stop:1117 length:942 start_codon:yes stop_codon:yes gene_type:complete